MTPITKNVRVVDQNGNEYEATYQRRAKGLAKNGRARFIDDNTIMLARPPDNIKINSEDNMDTLFNGNGEAVSENIPANQEPAQTEIPVELKPTAPAGLTLEWVLTRTDQIINDTIHISNALSAIREIKSSGPDGSAGRMAEAFADVVKQREETSRKLLQMLDKMYDDLKPKGPPRDVGRLSDEQFQKVMSLANGMPPSNKERFIRSLIGISE